MTRRRDVPASVRARLSNWAKENGEEFQRVLVRYAIEGFLRRLAASRHRDDFVMKGAGLYLVWRCETLRHTRDIDLLGIGDRSPEGVRGRIAEVCSIEVTEDGLSFDAASFETATIREDDEYQGVRVRFDALLAAARIKVQVDVGFGDAVVPAPEVKSFPALLDLPAPRVRAYTLESVVAEKFHAMVTLGEANGRLKDFYDLRTFSRELPIDGTTLVRAVRTTFQRRTTAVPVSAPTCLLPRFYEDGERTKLWTSFLRRQRLDDVPGGFASVCEDLRGFLMPVLDAVAAGRETPGAWRPGGPWR